VPHFIVGVELSDHSGSLYSTAYDEQAKRIFWDEEGVIHKLMKFDEKQLKDVVEDYYYQEFKLRMYTKKDHEGRIKHNMGKLEHIIPEKSAMENVQKIREMMGLHM
jgi:dTDP-4-dehydrorhamnose 3,5-epimerase-like enzyme